MANGIFNQTKTDLLTSSYAGWAADHRVILLDHADDNPSLTTDDNLDDIAGAARVATSGALGSPTSGSTGAGQADASDVTFSSVSGDQSEGLCIYQHTGTESTSRLVVKLDTGVTGLPVTPNGGNITVTWDTYIWSVAA